MTPELNVIVLCGASGSGKTYLRDMMTAPTTEQWSEDSYCNTLYPEKNPYINISFHAPIQVTTRERRGSYDNGYIFLSEKHYNDIGDQLTARTLFNDNYYGTLINNLVFGRYVYNLIVASKEGKEDIEKNLVKQLQDKIKCHECSINILSALVLSDVDEATLLEHGRESDFYKNEIFDLTRTRYDFYIPNYKNDRCDVKKLLKILNLR